MVNNTGVNNQTKSDTIFDPEPTHNTGDKSTRAENVKQLLSDLTEAIQTERSKGVKDPNRQRCRFGSARS